MALHVFGVVPAGTAVPDISGVGEAPGPLRLVEWDGLAAVVSELAEDGELTEDDAVHHLDVLCAFVAKTAVLPLRFGTTAPDVEAVREEILAPSADALSERLAALGGLVELRIDMYFDERQVLHAVVGLRPELREVAARSGGMAEMLGAGEAVTEAVRQFTQERGEGVVGQLAGLVSRVELLPGGQDPLEQRWALLVERDRVPDLDEAVSAIGGELPEARLEYVGPFPVFDFPDAAIESDSGSRWGW